MYGNYGRGIPGLEDSYDNADPYGYDQRPSSMGFNHQNDRGRPSTAWAGRGPAQQLGNMASGRSSYGYDSPNVADNDRDLMMERNHLLRDLGQSQRGSYHSPGSAQPHMNSPRDLPQDKTARAYAFLQNVDESQRRQDELENQKQEVQRLRDQVQRSMETLRHLQDNVDQPPGPSGYADQNGQQHRSHQPVKSILKKPKRDNGEQDDEERKNYCNVCSIQFNSAREYQQHCTGLLHTKQLMQQKMGISMDKEKPPSQESRQSSSWDESQRNMSNMSWSDEQSDPHPLHPQHHQPVSVREQQVQQQMRQPHPGVAPTPVNLDVIYSGLDDYEDETGGQTNRTTKRSGYVDGGNVPCKLCNLTFYTNEDLRNHSAHSDHCRKYLMMQAAMGTDKFLAKYKDVSFGLVMKPFSPQYDRHVRADLSAKEVKRYKDFLNRSGSINQMQCRLCSSSTFLLEHWLAHCCGRKHARMSMSKIMSMTAEDYLKEYGDLPGPAPSKSIDAKLIPKWETVYIIEALKAAPKMSVIQEQQKAQRQTIQDVAMDLTGSLDESLESQDVRDLGIQQQQQQQQAMRQQGLPWLGAARIPAGIPRSMLKERMSEQGAPQLGMHPQGMGQQQQPSPQQGMPRPGAPLQQDGQHLMARGNNPQVPRSGLLGAFPGDEGLPVQPRRDSFPDVPGYDQGERGDVYGQVRQPPYGEPAGRPAPMYGDSDIRQMPLGHGQQPPHRPDPYGREPVHPQPSSEGYDRDDRQMAYVNPFNQPAGPPSRSTPQVIDYGHGPQREAPPMGFRDRDARDMDPHNRDTRDRDTRDRDPHNRDPHNRDAHNRDAHNRDVRDRDVRDRDVRDRDVRDRDARDFNRDRDMDRNRDMNRDSHTRGDYDHRHGGMRDTRYDNRDSDRGRDHRERSGPPPPGKPQMYDPFEAEPKPSAEEKPAAAGVVPTTKALHMLHQLQEKQRLEQKKLEKQLKAQQDELNRQKKELERERQKHQKELEKQQKELKDKQRKLEDEKRKEELKRKEKEKELEREKKLRMDEIRRQQQMKDDLERKRLQRQKEELERKKQEKIKQDEERKAKEEKEKQEQTMKQALLKQELQRKVQEELELKRLEKLRKAAEERKKQEEERKKQAEIERMRQKEMELQRILTAKKMEMHHPNQNQNQGPKGKKGRGRGAWQPANAPVPQFGAQIRPQIPGHLIPVPRAMIGMRAPIRPGYPVPTAVQAMVSSAPPTQVAQVGLVTSAPWNTSGVPMQQPTVQAPWNHMQGVPPVANIGAPNVQAAQPPWNAGRNDVKAAQPPWGTGKAAGAGQKNNPGTQPAPWNSRDKDAKSKSDNDSNRDDMPWKRRDREDRSRERDRGRRDEGRGTRGSSRDRDSRGPWSRDRDRRSHSRERDRGRSGRKTPPSDLRSDAPWHKRPEDEQGSDAPWVASRRGAGGVKVEPGHAYKLVLNDRDQHAWKIAQADFIQCMDSGGNTDRPLRVFTNTLQTYMRRIQDAKDRLPQEEILATLSATERQVINQIQDMTGLEPPSVVTCTLHLLQAMDPRVFNILGTMDPNFMQSLISDAMAGRANPKGPEPRPVSPPVAQDSRDAPPWLRGMKRSTDQPQTEKRGRWN